MSKPFGERVREAREARGWSQGELGAKIGVSGPQISRIESGERGGSASSIVALATVLDIDLNLLKPTDPLSEAETESMGPPPISEDAPTEFA